KVMTDEGIPLLLFQVATLLLVRDTHSEHPIQRNDLSVSNGDSRPVRASSGLQSLKSKLKGGVLFSGGCPGRLCERRFQPAGSFAGPSAFLLAAASFISPRT